ncbi:hypothetical protein PENTCL1PPCAC_8571, partial [Pristionchus entomophagus]
NFQGEEVHAGGVCSKQEDMGGLLVYRINDQPYYWSGGVVVDAQAEVLKGLELKGIHRDTAIFMKQGNGVIPTVKRICSKSIVLECVKRNKGFSSLFKWNSPSWTSTMFVSDESPFVYLSNGQCVFIIHVETLTLRTLNFR